MENTLTPEKMSAALEALEALVDAIPGQNGDRDWWSDELTAAVAQAKKLYEGR